MDELCLPELETALAKGGLEIRYEDCDENFLFCDASEERVRRVAVVPIAIQGYCGELRICLIPNASTPLLISKGDMKALRARLDFGRYSLRLRSLSDARRQLDTTPA